MKHVGIAGPRGPLAVHCAQELRDRGPYEVVDFDAETPPENKLSHSFGMVVCASTLRADALGRLQQLLDRSGEIGVERFVFVSSAFAACADAPAAQELDELQTIAKMERAVHTACQPSMSTVVVRMPLVFGAGPTMPVSVPKDLVRLGEGFPVGRGSAHVLCAQQAAQAVIGALEFGVAGTTYTVAGTVMDYPHIAARMVAVANLPQRHIRVALGGEPMGVDLFLSPAARAFIGQANVTATTAGVEQALRYWGDDAGQAISATVASVTGSRIGVRA